MKKKLAALLWRILIKSGWLALAFITMGAGVRIFSEFLIQGDRLMAAFGVVISILSLYPMLRALPTRWTRDFF